MQKLEQEIDALERRQAVITQELEGPEVWSDGVRSAELTRELKQNAERLTQLTAQWEEAASKIA